MVTNKDKAEFRAYLQQCTDAQVRGVLEKERDARRVQYFALAHAEMERRGLYP